MFIDNLKNKNLAQFKKMKKSIIVLLFLGLGTIIGLSASYFPLQWIIIGIGALLILFAFFFLDPAYWIIIMLFLLFFGPIGIIKVGDKTPNLFYEDFYLLALIFLLTTVWLQKRKIKFIASNYALFILLFLIAGVLSLFNTPDFLRGLGFLKIFLAGFLVFFLCINTINKKSDIRKIIYSLPFFGAIIAVLLCYNVFTAESLTKANIYISWGGSNYLATFFIFLIPISMGLFFYKKNTLANKFYLFVCLILMIIGLITTSSKGGLIIFAFVILIFSILIFRKKPIKVLAIITFLILIIVFHPMSNFILNKFQTFFSNYPQSVMGRTRIFDIAIKTFSTHPIIGGGLGSFNYYMKQFLGPAQAGSTYKVHNEYLHILAEMGSIGLTLLLSLFIISYKNIRKLIKTTSAESFIHWWAIGVLVGFISMLAHIFIEPSFFGTQFFVLFWITMGLVYINLRILNKEKWIKSHSLS